MKKVVEEVVDRNQNIIEYVIRLAEENRSWIFVSGDLYKHLESDYRKDPFFKDDGAYFYDNNQKRIGIQCEKCNCMLEWKEVTDISKLSVFTAWASDSEVIYFLS